MNTVRFNPIAKSTIEKANNFSFADFYDSFHAELVRIDNETFVQLTFLDGAPGIPTGFYERIIMSRASAKTLGQLLVDVSAS